MPRTEAGKRHAERHPPCSRTEWNVHTHNGECPNEARAEIEVIEAEAVAAERERIRAAVEGLFDPVGLDWINRAAVLAIINREDK